MKVVAYLFPTQPAVAYVAGIRGHPGAYLPARVALPGWQGSGSACGSLLRHRLAAGTSGHPFCYCDNCSHQLHPLRLTDALHRSAGADVVERATLGVHADRASGSCTVHDLAGHTTKAQHHTNIRRQQLHRTRAARHASTPDIQETQ